MGGRTAHIRRGGNQWDEGAANVAIEERYSPAAEEQQNGAGDERDERV